MKQGHATLWKQNRRDNLRAGTTLEVDSTKEHLHERLQAGGCQGYRDAVTMPTMTEGAGVKCKAENVPRDTERERKRGMCCWLNSQLARDSLSTTAHHVVRADHVIRALSCPPRDLPR